MRPTRRLICDWLCVVRLHRVAMAELAGDIVAGRLEAGDVLPREVDLAERFDVSRGVARECLRGLEERGLVRVKHGHTTTVRPREEWELFDEYVLAAALGGPAAAELLGEYLEVRRIIEIESAGLAAERATPERLEALEERFAAMQAAADERDARVRERAFHEADIRFHVAVVEATGNAALASLIRRFGGALLAARYPLARPAYRKSRALPEHRAIFEAILERDPEAARVAMRRHLDTVEAYLCQHARRIARDT